MISRLIKVSALVLLVSLAHRPALAAESVCASVQLRIQQTLTLERQAFDAHLGITNGQAAADVANVDVDLVVTDQQGNPVLVSYDPYDPDAQNVKFFIRLDRMENIGDVSGAGTVSPGTVADVHWLIIPTIGAAEGTPAGKTYRIGATLSYTLAGELFAMDIEPDSILVKPLPALFVDYFFPADVYADDPFTPQIEPAIPFTIGQRVANTGVGAAKGVAIESSQVQILENEQNVLVGFRLEGAEVNGLAATTSLQAALGDIAPATAATARWTMTTTLSGRFSAFTAQYTHADELGGAVTSVIAGTGVHSLVRDVLADLPGKDQIRDFLAADAGGYVLYESENLNTSVADLTSAASLLLVGQSGAEDTYALAAPATTGYGFLRLADPLAGQRVLKLVQRSDGKLIGADNVWLSKTYDKTAGQWNHFVSLFDVNTTGSYTVVFADPPDAPHAPVLQFIPDKVVVEGGELSFSVLATDADGTTPALFAAPLLAGAVFVDGGLGSGTFSWTPAEGQAGSYTVTFTAGDGALFDAKNVLITVRPIWDTDGDGLPDAWEVQYFGNLSRDGSGDFDGDGVSDRDEYLAGTNPANRAPALDPIGAKSVAENATLEFTVTATDPDGTTPAITASGLPAGAAFDGALFSWTPTFDQAGMFAVTFRASDGEREDSEIVQITVLNVNRVPTVPLIVAPQTLSEVTTVRPSLVVQNSVDPDADPVLYQFEIYPNVDMKPEELETASGWVAEQPGTTSWTVDVDLADNAKHFWRVLSSDGSLPSLWAYANFFVNTANDAPGPFDAAAPADGADVATVTPELSVNNSSDIDGDAVSYSFFVSTDEEPPQLIDSANDVPAGTGGSTAWTVTVPLADNAWYFWMAVATDEHGLSTQVQPLAFFVNTANDAPTTPTVATPADGSEVATASVELTVTNATDLDGNALTYFFVLDTADTFDTPGKVVSGPVAQGDGSTFWLAAELIENTRYHWRCKAADEWVESNWMTASFFVNATNDAPGVPTPLNPGAGSYVDSATPRLEVSAATDPDLDAVVYEYEVYAQPPGSPVATGSTVATEWVVAPPLALYAWHSWRARAVDEHGLAGDWTDLTAFFTDNNGIDDPPTITVTEPAAAIIQAGGTFTITWSDGDPDSDASIALYRDNDGSGANGTLIVSGLSEDQDGPAGSYVWDLAGVPSGAWYVYGVISDANSTGTDYAPGSVTIDSLPVANAGPDQAGTIGQELSFSGAASSDPDGTIVSYLWNWGDGSLDDTGVSATHAYLEAGTMTVTLTITDDLGGTSTDTAIVTISDVPVNLALNKTASASSSRRGSSYVPANAVDGSASTYWRSNAGGTQWIRVDLGSSFNVNNVKLTWNNSYRATNFRIETSTDAGANPTNWTQQWSTASGTATVDANFTGMSARHVRVYCTSGASTSNYRLYELEAYGGPPPPNQAPVADAGADQTGYAGSAISFTGSGMDADGTIVGYSWDWGDGSADSDTQNASHIYAVAGTYLATLTVTDNQGATDSDTATVTVNVPQPNQAPVANAGSDKTGNAGSAISFTGSGTDADGTIAGYSWNWGDGTSNTNTQNASHTYAAAGTFTATLTVTDNFGATGSDTAAVTVNEVPVNLALNKTATASSSRSGSSNVPANAVDGNSSTYWRSNATGTQWLQVDLGSSNSVSNVKVSWDSRYYAGSFQIQTSNDGTNFTTQYSTTSGSSATTEVTFTTVGAQYVRVYCTVANSSNYRITELEVYQ